MYYGPKPNTMLRDTLEPAWAEAFETVLGRCGLRPRDTVAVLSESQSRALLPQLARLAAARLGCRSFAIELPTPLEPARPVVRSPGACTALGQLAPAIAALSGSTPVVDCTVEGLIELDDALVVQAGRVLA